MKAFKKTETLSITRSRVAIEATRFEDNDWTWVLISDLAKRLGDADPRNIIVELDDIAIFRPSPKEANGVYGFFNPHDEDRPALLRTDYVPGGYALDRLELFQGLAEMDIKVTAGFSHSLYNTVVYALIGEDFCGWVLAEGIPSLTERVAVRPARREDAYRTPTEIWGASDMASHTNVKVWMGAGRWIMDRIPTGVDDCGDGSNDYDGPTLAESYLTTGPVEWCVILEDHRGNSQGKSWTKLEILKISEEFRDEVKIIHARAKRQAAETIATLEAGV